MGLRDWFKRTKKVEFIPEIKYFSEYGSQKQEPKIQLPESLPSEWEKFKGEQVRFNKALERKKRQEDLT